MYLAGQLADGVDAQQLIELVADGQKLVVHGAGLLGRALPQPAVSRRRQWPPQSAGT